MKHLRQKGLTSGSERAWGLAHMTSERTRSKTEGLTLVEVLIAAAIILVAVVTLIGVHSLYLKVALGNADSVKAAYLAEEAIEAVRFMRDASWDANIATLSLGTEYGLTLSGSLWQASPSNLHVEEFRRTVIFSAVSRDANGDIVSSGGTVDPDTRLVVSSVSWPVNGATTTKSISTYLTNLYDD